MPQFEPGLYKAQITNQQFIQSPEKKTAGFTLGFRVLSSLDKPEEAVKPYRRDLTMWVTNKTFQRVMHSLRDLGYEGTKLSGVDPDTQGFHEFRDQEIEVECKHEENRKGQVFEQWELVTSKPKLTDKSVLDYFDRLLDPDPNPEPPAGSGNITDDDVPF
jgi:hypothetical protein